MRKISLVPFFLYINVCHIAIEVDEVAIADELDVDVMEK